MKSRYCKQQWRYVKIRGYRHTTLAMNSSTEVTTHCPHHHHCDRDAAKVKAVTIIAEQITRLKVIEFGGKHLWSRHTKIFVNILFVMIM